MSTIAIGATQARSRSRLRLTRRGRAVLTALASAPLVFGAFAFAINGGSATATFDAAPESIEFVTVAPGESLWTIAEQVAPQSDPREVIDVIMTLNRLQSADLVAGQELAVPSP